MTNTYHILAGYLPPELQGQANLSSAKIKANPYKFFPVSEIFPAMVISDWIRGSVYSSFGNSLGTNYPSLVKWSNNVWLCLSNNVQNLLNQFNASTIPPSTSVSEDGYTWVLAFETDSARRISQYTRIPSFDLLEKTVDANSENLCYDAGVTGYCLIYKQNSTGITGSLINESTSVGLLETNCTECQALTKIINTNTGYYVSFSESLPTSVSISLNNRTQKFNSIIDNWKYANNFEVQAAKTAIQSGLVEGAILGSFINSSILGLEIPTDTTIGISSGTGTSGDIRFVLGNIIGSTGEITGITLVNRGQNYSENLTATVTSSGLTAGQIDQLQSAITLVCANNESQSIDGINNVFNIPQQFSGIVNLINYNLLAYNPEGITFNYYALVTNSSNESLPVEVKGIQSIPFSEYNQSEDSRISYAIQFIRPYI